MPKIPASERDAFYETRRNELCDAALRLWAENGFDATSVATIAEASGISKGTFYLYFESKRSLLAEVLRRNSLVPHVVQLIADLQSSSLEDAVRAFVRGAWRTLRERRDLILVVLRELPTHIEEAQRMVEEVIVPGNKLIAAYLEARVPPERTKQLSFIIASRSLLGMIIFVFLTQEVLGAGRFLEVSEDEITATISELFLRGVTGSSIGGT